MEKYLDLNKEIGRLWKLKIVNVVPVVIGDLEIIRKNSIGGLKS